MSRSPLGRIAGTTAIFLGLILAPTTAATADTTPAELSPEQVTAMQSAFGLSEAGVTDLLRAQEEATALETELREELGADFGGAVFDIESQELTVQVLDASALDPVQEAGADAELVQHGQTGLDEAVEALNTAEDSASESVHGWYADPESDAVVVEVAQGRTADAEQLVESAGVDPTAVVIEEGTDQPRTYADIIGGNPYYFQQGGEWFVCSVGFGVVGGYVTAGHCGDQGSSTWLNAPGTVQTGTVAESVFPGQDSAWVRTGAGHTPRPLVDNYSGGTVTVTGSTEAPVGAAVCRSGQTTGWHCGVIQAKNQSVNYSGDIVNGLTRTTACAEGGDSGGSWLAGTQAQGVTSGGSGNCRSGGTTFYQPLNPILSQWGLTLLTS
ncbi:S1 family peptidase [Nocardiopsis exhalans]|uniref:S1 family peptidase n=1 Tax=Nocardiopsis exhalans TaxID=163604 RepID=A0ABY5D8T0_9ACTN|nr:S1 family peptidase [Nocardiopsis exhalans]USY19468.1 S1 family peptidase [Nocardiopsis exhalans]